MDGWIDFQADGAAHHQMRCQRVAGDERETDSYNIGFIFIIELDNGQASLNEAYSQFFFLKK
jgi:hypothetical protein